MFTISMLYKIIQSSVKCVIIKYTYEHFHEHEEVKSLLYRILRIDI